MLIKKILATFLLTVSSVRLIPHLILLNFHRNKEIIHYDIKRWLSCYDLTEKYGIQRGFLYLMTFRPEYRNLFYYRIGVLKYFLMFLCRPLKPLFLHTPEIGPGLFIQHGFSTTIGARSIGKDCWINQQVTIGFTNKTDCPIIGDNVTIYAGAKVLGKVTVGKNSVIGANAVVVKDVPPNCTVVGIPAYIIKRNGVKVREEL